MERRLYDESPYITEWQADVERITPEGGKFNVTLAETAFYPGGGGQPSDRGTLDGIAIEDVFEKDGRIYHVLGKAPENRTVKCLLDMGRRFDLMQQHTGQHLLSAVIYKLYDRKTSSLHMGMEELSIDVEMPEMPADMITAVEDEANRHIYRDLPVVTHVVSAAQASEIDLRKEPPKEGVVRILEITSVDRSPCCGTHVRRTGEIGIVKIVKTEKRGNETRVYFKCGGRALKDYRFKHDIVSGLVHLFRMSEDEVLAKTESTAAQLRTVQKELAELKDRMLKVEAGDITSSAASKVIELSFKDKTFGDISALAKYILEKGEFVVILASEPDKRVMFARSGSIDVNCGKILKEHLASFGGKGGGKDNWANGGFGSVEDLVRFMAFLRDLVSTKAI